MLYFVLSAVLLILISCCNVKNEKITSLPEVSRLVCKPTEIIQLVTRFPAFIGRYSGGIIVFNPLEEREIIAVFNEETGKQIFSYGQRGKGPGEFFTPMVNRWVEKSNELILFDPNLTLFYILQFSDTAVTNKTEIAIAVEPAKYESLIMVCEDMFAGITFNNEGRIELFDRKGNVLSAASYTPIKTQVDFIPSSILAYDEETGLLISAAIDFGYIAAYQINLTEPAIKQYWEISISEVVLTNKDNKIILDETKCLAGFTQLKISGNKIFTLYKGKEIIKHYGRSREALPENLLVISSNGKIISNYSLECPLFRFSVNESNDQLIGITLEENFKIVYYDLPEHLLLNY